MFNQFNVEDKWYTYTDKIMSVSGELFVNNDVDISGNLTLKGSLGVLDTSTNDISYGNVGTVLTSGGPGNPVSWETPITYSAGTGVTLTGTTFSIGQSVGTSDNVTFLSVEADTFLTPVSNYTLYDRRSISWFEMGPP